MQNAIRNIFVYKKQMRIIKTIFIFVSVLIRLVSHVTILRHKTKHSLYFHIYIDAYKQHGVLSLFLNIFPIFEIFE